MDNKVEDNRPVRKVNSLGIPYKHSFNNNMHNDDLNHPLGNAYILGQIDTGLKLDRNGISVFYYGCRTCPFKKTICEHKDDPSFIKNGHKHTHGYCRMRIEQVLQDRQAFKLGTLAKQKQHDLMGTLDVELKNLEYERIQTTEDDTLEEDVRIKRLNRIEDRIHKKREMMSNLLEKFRKQEEGQKITVENPLDMLRATVVDVEPKDG